ncbi:hypothetical protein CKO28_23545 [Rhodovibrio sodomensis]|uniref:Methyltransferase type 11 domain-containing protein n=1 Tax=Rhodovibrio sodomensis TaxID=1088 RepID=A0ABS1DLU3_9PROT|nr:class I SAM-dependent methyltransferase [Rhodovibrio sodomensis]MBK1670986.1 hypothetical protein [Rhodovibrio sodomensis]
MGFPPSSLIVIQRHMPAHGRILTIGRQILHRRRSLHSKQAADHAEVFADYIHRTHPSVAVEALDGSAYEGAEIVHDLNVPIEPDSALAANTYDMVLDGGTLEHVANPLAGLYNYLTLLKEGGVLYVQTPATNYFGHGFYQFSSDFFYRFCNATGGAEVLDCFLEEHRLNNPALTRNRYYDAPDPAHVNRRTMMHTRTPVLIHVVARKTGPTRLPHALVQSDYQTVWHGEKTRLASGRATGLAKSLGKAAPWSWYILDRLRMARSMRLGRTPNFPRRTGP